MLRTPARRPQSALMAVLSAAMLFVGPVVLRAEDPPAPTTTPVTRPATRPSNPEAHAKALRIIADALAKYRAAKSYEDKFAGKYELVAKDAAGNDAGQTTEYSAALLWSGRERLSLVTDNFSLVTDGKNLWRYLPMLDEYTEAAAPEKPNYAELITALPTDDPPHLILHVREQTDKSFAELFPMVREFTAVTPETRGEHPGVRLSGVFDSTDTPFAYESELLPFSLWFDEHTGLLGELRVDLTNVLKKALGLTEDKPAGEEEPDMPGYPKQVTHAIVSARFDDVRMDMEVPADRFVFRPPAGAEKVAQFTDLSEMPDPRELIGKPAPLFAGTALDEKPLALEELRGRVVIVDFWATWCAPCVQAMPQIQKLHLKYADKPVTVIGVNQDDKRTEAKIKPFLKDKEITFRQLPDPKGKIARKYKVAGIPCTFLLDKKGTVQAVHVGLSMSLEEDIGGEIEKLLNDENLFDPEKLRGESATPAKP
ncbi:MAG: TlpA disulfide reductase family protein [Planctomycetota bacterium]